MGRRQPMTRHILVRHLTFGCILASRRSSASVLCTYPVCPSLTPRIYKTFIDRTRKKSIDIYSNSPTQRAVPNTFCMKAAIHKYLMAKTIISTDGRCCRALMSSRRPLGQASRSFERSRWPRVLILKTVSHQRLGHQAE